MYFTQCDIGTTNDDDSSFELLFKKLRYGYPSIKEVFHYIIEKKTLFLCELVNRHYVNRLKINNIYFFINRLHKISM